MQDHNALSMVLRRNAFYRRFYFLALGALMLNIVVIMALASLMLYIKNHPTRPVYFATDEIGRLINVVPVNRPNMSTDEVLAWVKEAIESTYSYDFVNYRLQMQDAEKYFSSYGWSKYISALIASNNVEALTQRKMVVMARVIGKPKIMNEGNLVTGEYAWEFEVPVLLTFWYPPYDDKSKFTNTLIVQIRLQRQPILQSYKGLGIVQIIGMNAVPAAVQQQEISDVPSN